MKNILFFILIIAFLCSCRNSKCKCDSEFNPSIIYHKGDTVMYHDTCWIANTTGRTTPRPWLEKGNDLWKVCEE